MIILGLMSGTSLDGLDIAACEFYETGGNYEYRILASKAYSYDDSFVFKLKNAISFSAKDFVRLDREYGILLGDIVNGFCEEFNLKPDYIASHGHTIFHEPDKNITFQLGSGAYISASTGIPTISDFRTLDIALGGQGAPLVPIGDALLFGEYDYCINLGGFANISFDEGGNRKAYDICPVNFVLNKLAQEFDLDYDKNGELGKRGEVIPELLAQLNKLDYYKQKGPKSLGSEWVEVNIFPLLGEYDNTVDVMTTFYEHVSQMIKNAVKDNLGKSKILLTGGGTYNDFLIEKIRCTNVKNWVIPDRQTIEFKEALIFAFLGYLRVNNKINTLASVTGASVSSIGGCICLSGRET